MGWPKEEKKRVEMGMEGWEGGRQLPVSRCTRKLQVILMMVLT